MPIKQVKNKDEAKKEQVANKPLLNIQLPAPASGDPNASLSIGKHNASAQYNFQQVANVLLTIINNQKIMGMAIGQTTKKQKELESSINSVSKNIRKLLKNKENDKPKSDTSTK